MVSNIYLKFSELAVLDKDEQPFSNTYGATSAAVLTEFLSLDDITYSSIEDLVAFVSAKLLVILIAWTRFYMSL